jgi:transcriptional regulator with GAF, ATPase, and Fis domain/predicted negative regulator of RcsB-dependent stress response
MVLPPRTVLQRRYEIGQVLGRGTAATTYAAHDAVLGRDVALKVLHAATPELLGALADELNRLRGLWHPHLARVLDLGTDRIDGKAYWFLASERVVGASLNQFALGHEWSDLELAVCDTLDALGFLHRIGTRHGDVKPENILVTDTGRGVLIDLGCARSLRGTSDIAPCGTPAFMAPELLQGDAVDERTDLFALGKSLLALPVTYPEPVQQLLTRMCATRLNERPANTDEALEWLGHPRPVSASISGRSTRLIERDQEVAHFNELLDALLEGRPAPRAVLLQGPSGIGRTRLLDELKWIAQTRCTVVAARTQSENTLAECLTRATKIGDQPTSLQSVLALRDGFAGEAVALVIDDAQSLSEREASWLAGLLRTTDDHARLLLIIASTTAIDHQHNVHVVDAALAPLTMGGVEQWVGEQMSAAAITALHRLTGGFPGYVQLALDRLGSGTLREADLITGRTQTLDVPISVAGFDQSDLAAMAALTAEACVTHARLSSAEEVDAMGRCVARGLATAVDQGFCLTRAADAEGLRAVLPRELVRAAHARATRDVPDPHDDAAQATHVFHLLHAGEVALARKEIIAVSHRSISQPRKWLTDVLLLLKYETTADTLLAAIRVALQAGESKQTLSLIARLMRTRPPTDVALEARCLAADCYSQLGLSKRAHNQLTRARTVAAGEQHAAVEERIARVLLQQAAYEQAKDVALDALANTPDTALRARLQETIGVACTYLGDRESALRALNEAERFTPRSDTRARFRCLSYRAMLELRAGHVTEASLGYSQALRLAEASGLADLYVNAALNAGSVAQQLGDWGPMLSSYDRAISLAQALGKQSTLASLQFNLANLYCEIGAFDRAATMRRECASRVHDFSITRLHPYLMRLEAELHVARQRNAAGRDAYLVAKTSFERIGARREVVEIDVELARLALDHGDTTGCARQLDAIETQLSSLAADDVSARTHLVRARWLVAAGKLADALPSLENAISRARAAEHRVLCVDILQTLADVHTALNSHDLATTHRKEAIAICARIAATLPTTMRDTFYAHPSRRLMAPLPPETTDAPSATPLGFDVSGFLEINRRINSALSVEQVLSHAMDAAIALTGAERGFVLLADERKDVDVTVARNVDREHLGKAHMKFSRSIAEQVMLTEQPLLTVDAGTDSRFAAQQSVHAMKLKSVVCVPIRSPLGVLGALYLDNRFQRARFRQTDVDVLMAFADSVAIALTNARLHVQLEQRTRELEEERRRVEKLARGQAIEIGRLQGELEQQQRALELRHDYSSIVSRSARMREVLGTLDRVTDSNLSVLIQGESGTGKEVIARALHFNGPRRKQAFVSLNCGALPEPLLESELFGHVKGAFTGADRDRPGLFVAARGGTLLLDEVGEMSQGMQVKLLRVLQEREVRRVGSTRTESVDVRVLCATNRNLHDEVSAGRFREDLYYRIAVVDVTLPPLRERTDDIADLADVLLARLCANAHKPVPRLSSDAVQALQTYAWPGNVRELENVLSRALVMCEGDQIRAVDLALGVRRRRSNARDRNTFERDEATSLFSALTTRRWNISAVSRDLGIPRNTLYRKLEKYRLTREPNS